MMHDAGKDLTHRFNAAQNFAGDVRMKANDVPFVLRKRRGLEEHCVGNADFPKVVKEGRVLDGADLDRTHPHTLGELPAVAGNAARMSGCIWIALVDDGREALKRLHERGVCKSSAAIELALSTERKHQ